MILLSALCVALYVLGGMLAWGLLGLHVETENGRRSAYRDPSARWTAVLLWPLLAFSMVFVRAEDGQ